VSVVLLVALAVTGCSKRVDDKKKIIGFVDATTPHAYRLSYDVKSSQGEQTVQGIVQDDFRYKLQLTVGKKTAAEQVVVDDAVALRFFDTDLLAQYVDPAVKGKVDTKTDVAGATVFDALGAGRWVLDPAGAPSPILETRDTAGKAGSTAAVPKDPLFDARTALNYVRIVANGTPFKKYDPESIEPTYRKDEDPFPAPGAGSGVTRYDSYLAPLPAPAQATGGNRSLPGAQSFRKMAVYVKHGTVIAVREFIGLSPRQRRQLQSYEEALLKEVAGPDILASFRAQLKPLHGSAVDDALIKGLNALIATVGGTPVQLRTMSLVISDLDAVSTRVSLPTDVVRGDLAVIRNIGRKPADTGAGA
jgi:hypothetical protein